MGSLTPAKDKYGQYKPSTLGSVLSGLGSSLNGPIGGSLLGGLLTGLGGAMNPPQPPFALDANGNPIPYMPPKTGVMF